MKGRRVVAIDQPSLSVAHEHDGLKEVGLALLPILSVRRLVVPEGCPRHVARDAGAEVAELRCPFGLSATLFEPGNKRKTGQREGVLEQEKLRRERSERPSGVDRLHGDIPLVERGADRRRDSCRIWGGLGWRGRLRRVASAGGIVRSAGRCRKQGHREETTHEYCSVKLSVRPRSVQFQSALTRAPEAVTTRQSRWPPRNSRSVPPAKHVLLRGGCTKRSPVVGLLPHGPAGHFRRTRLHH